MSQSGIWVNEKLKEEEEKDEEKEEEEEGGERQPCWQELAMGRHRFLFYLLPFQVPWECSKNKM